MLAPLVPLLFWLLVPPPFEGVEEALRGLTSSRVVERAAAERWLASHLEPEDLALLASAAQEAGPEAQRRLGSALGSDERHFALVALLATDSKPGPRALGELSMLRLASAWLGDDGLEPASSLSVLKTLVDGRQQEYRWVPAAGTFESVIDALVQGTSEHGRREPGFEALEVVLDPGLRRARFAPRGRGQGPVPNALVIEDEAVNLLMQASMVQGVATEGFALGGTGSARPWLHLVPQDLVGKRRADELLVSWVRAVLAPDDAQRARAAARALGACGWNAPLDWLGSRWLERGDANAMEGVLLAASRGRVAPLLMESGRVAALLREADAALAAKDPVGRARAPLIMHALAALPPVASDGRDLTLALVRDWDALGPRKRMLRAEVLRGMGRAPSDWVAGLRRELADPTDDLPLELASIGARALAAIDEGRAPSEATPFAAFVRALESAHQSGTAVALVETLARARLLPPDDLRDPAALPAAWGLVERALTAEIWLRGLEAPQVAAAHVRAMAAGEVLDGALAAGGRLRKVASPAWLASVLVVPAGAGPDDGTLRLAAVAGVLPEASRATLIEALDRGEEGVEPRHLVLLGCLAGAPDGERARKLLSAAIKADVEGTAWVAPFERAHADLMAAGEDDEASALLRSIRSPLRRSSHPKRGDLMRRRWPRPPGARPFPLEALQVNLEPL